jgi:fatty-acyl-CoA synthase
LAATVARAGLVIPERPDRLARAAMAFGRWGQSVAGLMAAASARYPDRVAIVDDHGSHTYAELWEETNAVANGLIDEGVKSGATVGILHRNSYRFISSVVAAAKVGASTVFLNTEHAPPQVEGVVEGEGIDVVLHDRELADLVEKLPIARFDGLALAALGASSSTSDPTPPRRTGRTVILTSGTTGRPKGAVRASLGGGVSGGASGAGLLERIPFRVGQTVVVAPPLFHSWGLASAFLTLGLSGTVVVASRFDAEGTLALVARTRAQALIVVPVMLHRMLALDDETIARHDTASLKIIASSGSAIGAPLATRTLDQFGPVLYNAYGSTEVSIATVATPADLRAQPDTVGRPVLATRVEVLDSAARSVRIGTTGRVFVGSDLRFDGYTGGGGKEERRGMLSTGDVGHFDEAGRLMIDGREDDMIVSGGENVFPGEVEDVLHRHDAVADVAVVGVPDEEFGQRLRAYVVRARGVTVTEKALRDHVRSQLARFKVPREVVFVDELPRTATGKLLRRELREMESP